MVPRNRSGAIKYISLVRFLGSKSFILGSDEGFLGAKELLGMLE
jgi:hypothetical protein